jgi:hypothetical protein
VGGIPLVPGPGVHGISLQQVGHPAATANPIVARHVS